MTSVRRPNRRPVPELQSFGGAICPDFRKIRYVEERAAQAALAHLARRDPDPVRAARLHVFRCPHCRDFHVGHSDVSRQHPLSGFQRRTMLATGTAAQERNLATTRCVVCTQRGRDHTPLILAKLGYAWHEFDPGERRKAERQEA
jgi:hypothetical protein